MAIHTSGVLSLTLSLLLISASTSLSPSRHPDAEALLAFKSLTSLPSTWDPWTSPCSWHGVSCLQNRVSRLVLEGLNLSSPFPTSLLSLTSLRVLSLKHNHFYGLLPSNLSSLSSLKLLFLSYNYFSGPFPSDITSLFHLYRLDLSHNNFSGLIPQSLNRLPHLLTLRLEHNAFSGHISWFNLVSIQDFNVSSNHLLGLIPNSLSSFDLSAFSANEALCGPPLPTTCIQQDPTKPGTDPTVVSSNPVSPRDSPTPNKSSHRRMSLWAIISIILGDILVLAAICLFLYCYFWRSRGSTSNKHNGGSGAILGGEKVVYSTSPYTSTTGQAQCGQDGKMVFFQGSNKFELEDLLKASAEMLGKGAFGTAYKAVLDDGSVVAVKRLREANVGGKKEFEQQMEVLGRLRHSNLLCLKAYYFARDEKLLVFDYLPNGSLFSLLHGNRGPGRRPLDWTTRLKIGAGAAEGVAFIHNSCKALKLIHGNIKSTNVLIDKAGIACVSDFGLSSFAPTSPRSNGYRAPESVDGCRLTQRADVYSFGVLLLELLTGKLPSVVEGSGPYGSTVVDLPRWVESVVREEWTAEVFDLELMRYKDIEEEMVGLLQIAMACTSASPEQRPRMGQVVKMMEDLRGVQVSPSHHNFDSVSEDTGDSH